ncbi:hypothetical protein HMI54_008686 [Coelomomyces lativittatus]|nr:hypothetical protein HMI54_008686 [Coelomomyces lativittatus]
MLTTTSILLDKTPSLLDLKYPSRIPRWKNLTTPSTTLSPCPSSPSHSKHASFLDSKEKKKECQLILHTLQVWRKQWQVHYTSWRQGITADVLGQYKCILHALKAWRTCTFLLKNEKLAIQLDGIFKSIPILRFV